LTGYVPHSVKKGGKFTQTTKGPLEETLWTKRVTMMEREGSPGPTGTTKKIDKEIIASATKGAENGNPILLKGGRNSAPIGFGKEENVLKGGQCLPTKKELSEKK